MPTMTQRVTDLECDNQRSEVKCAVTSSHSALEQQLVCGGTELGGCNSSSLHVVPFFLTPVNRCNRRQRDNRAAVG